MRSKTKGSDAEWGHILPAAAAFLCMALPAGAQTHDVADAPATVEKTVPTGEQVYNTWCLPCHSGASNAPGTMRLVRARGEDYPAVLTDNPALNDAYIRQVVRGGIGMMPAIRRTEIGEDELDRLIAFLVGEGE